MSNANRMLASLEAMIDRYGWAVQAVFPGEDSPGFAYSVGMADRGLPDVIVFGLPPEIAQRFVNHVCSEMAEKGKAPPLETDLNHFAEGLPTRFVAVPREQADEYMFAAKRRNPGYTAIQLVWPDNNSRFPWEPEFEQKLVKYQPVLRAQLH